MDGRKIGKSLNMVHNDEIWKDHIQSELLAQKHWPQKWGFLSEIYKELQPNNGDSAANSVETSAAASSSSGGVAQKAGGDREKFPETHSQMIGWKSALSKRNPYGIPEGRAEGRGDLYRTFNWPQEGQ